MTEIKSDSGSVQRVLVTGSRGKSSTVRFLHAAMSDAGLQSYARITGVVPRELGPDGNQTISRSSGAHVEEMRWWLGQLPASTQCIVLENSAISPDLQGLAGRWLRPDITVLTNTLPDHQEVWGPTRACAAQVLAGGIPGGGQVILPGELKTDNHLLKLLKRRRCTVIFSEPVRGGEEDHQSINRGLALTAAKRLGLSGTAALRAMLRVQPDIHDFRVVNYAGAELAMAFSANDITSTRNLFRSLRWCEQETRMMYNHRADRPGRFRSFLDWLNNSNWRDVMIIGDKPGFRSGSARYLDIKKKEGLLRLFEPGDKIFGCGNIAGLPLSLASVNKR